MKLLASGIDTVNLAVQGEIGEPVWDLLAEVQQRARLNEEPEVFSFPVTEEAFMCRPYGWRGYTYWLTSPDYEVMFGRSTKFPAALVQFHSPFLHSMGIDAALDQAERLFRLDLFGGSFKQGVSRIDVHADFQGWELRTADLDRFVGYGRHRRAFEENRQVFQSGSHLAGFMFGKDAMVARIYDKSAEARKHGVSWLPDLWGEDYDARLPVWRVEFQFRREALSDFQTKTVDEVIASVQDLWHYGTVRWLSLRVPTADRRRRRWPLDPAWQEIRDVRISPTMTGLVRRRIEQASELRLLQGIQGYATSLAAARGRNRRDQAMTDIGTLIDRYLASKGLVFEGEVSRKRSRRMSVTSWLDRGKRAEEEAS
jgi:hypothetical protein